MSSSESPPVEKAPPTPAPAPVPATTPAEKAPPAKPRVQVKGAAGSRESIWDLRKALPRRYSIYFNLALPVLVIGVWAILTAGDKPMISPSTLPSPLATIKGLIQLFFMDHCDDPMGKCVVHSYLLKSIGVSSLRILISFLLAAAVALPLGILMGAWEPINRLVEPVMAPLRYLPISALLPLFIMWLGIEEASKVAFLFLGVFVYLLPVVVTAVRAVPDELVQTARTLGATRLQVIRTVLVPAAMPDIFDAFRVMNAIAWTYVILAEVLNPRVGLGALIQLAYTHARPETASHIFAGLLVIGVIGILTDWVIRQLNGLLFRWREQEN